MAELTWEGKTVLVTGGGGFVGRNLIPALQARRPRTIVAPSSKDADLRRREEIDELLARVRPHVVIHLAGRVGGIGANRSNPGSFFYDNAVMGIQLMESARLARVMKFVVVGTVCAYPKFAPLPFREEDIWSGYPEETNAPYGLAKRMLLVQGQCYRQQYGFDSAHLLMANLYGPHDNFEIESSHVIPAMIRRFTEALDADRPSVVLWGSGRPTREFLFVDDGVEAILRAAERYDDPLPLNIGSGAEISIRELAELIAELIGYGGKIEWDATRPDGQPRRRLATERADRRLGFRATTDLRTGLRRTINWYREGGQSASALVMTR